MCSITSPSWFEVPLVRAVSSFLNNPIIPIFTKPLTLAENTALVKSWGNTKKLHEYVQPFLSQLWYFVKYQGLGWSLQGALSFGGVQQCPAMAVSPSLGGCAASVTHGGREEGRALQALPHTATTELGELWQMLPTAFQVCLLTIHCLGW